MTDEQKSELAALRAEREELRRQREARDAVDPVKAERKALEEEKLILGLEEKHGRVGVGLAMVRCGVDGTLLIGQKPHAATYSKFHDLEKADMKAIREFIAPCVVSPAREIASALLDEFPGVADKFAIELAKLCGFDPKG